MAELGPAAVVQQPQLIPPTVGLLPSATVIDEDGERWINGFQYAPEGCGEAEAFNLCANFTKDVSAAAPIVTGTPYGLVAQDTCTTFSYQTRDYQARATRKLMAMESFLLERELWDSPLGVNPGLADSTNPLFVDATPTPGTAVDLMMALATIEQAAIDCMPAKRIMIHMRPYILDMLLAVTGSSTLLRFDGTRYYTPMNNIVVPGRGYSGNSPTGVAPTTAHEWIYASSQVEVRHGPIFTNPPSLKEATNRQTNQVTFFAERAAQASFDYTCCVVGLEVSRSDS